MKKLFLNLCLLGFIISAHAGSDSPFNEKKTDKSSRQTSLKEALKALEKKYDVNFVWTNEKWGNLQVEYPAKETELDKILKLLLATHQLTYKKIDKKVYQIISEADKDKIETAGNVSGTALLTENILADVKITGVITDQDGNALEGATIRLKNGSKVTQSGKNGRFNLDISDAEKNDLLVISYVSFVTQEISIKEKTTFAVKMVKVVDEGQEIVVIGYGTRKKNDISGAVTQVNSDMINKQPITSIDQGLAGMVPGVTLREGTGAPGSGPEILIRGINTFGNNKPLIVIDDVIFENGNDQNNNPLALINPEDIESVTILKDAATKAIYGSRATAGVILVTTKKGKVGKARISFNSNVGFANVMKFEVPDVLNATELAQFYKEVNIDRIRATNATYADPSVPVPDNLLPINLQNPSQYGVGTNWFDAITRQAISQNHNISISGGTPVIKYFVSGNYLRQEGVVIENDLMRYAFRSNIDIKINDKLRFGLNLNPSRTEQNRPADDPGAGGFSAYSTITSSYWVDPSSPVFQPNGLYKYTTQGAITSNWTANPVYQLTAEQEKRRASQVLMGAYLEFEPVKNLIFKTNFNYNYSQGRSRNFQPSTLVGDGSLTPQFPNIDSARALLFNTSTNNIISDNTLRYRLIKGKHNAEVLVGYTVQDQSTENSTISAKRLADENFQLPDFNNVSQAVVGNFTGSEEFSKFRLTSIISRLNYSFANKYLLNLSVRRDGSSRFGRNVQYGTFPAGSVAWRITEEKFMRKLKDSWLSELRFEVGYGLTGNLNGVSPYGHLGSITTANYQFGTTYSLGNTLSGLPNPLITWEESKQFDVGLNASLFNRRFNLAFNVYEQITDGLLAAIPLSWITGFGSVTGNQDSRIRNRGFEVQVDGAIVRKRDFTWATSVNASRYVNKILEYYLPGGFLNGPAGNGTNVAISLPGEPIGLYRGLKTMGLFTAKEILDPTIPKYAGAREGSLKYLDGNGDGKLGIEEDYVILGNPHPDLLFGWNNQLTFKGFNLRTIFAGQLGGLIYDLRREIMWNVDGNFNIDRQMLNRWRPGDDPATKSFPTTTALTGSTTRYVRFPNDNKIYDGTYIALKNLTLGYNLASVLNTKKRIVEAAEFYIGMRNVFYLAKYKYGNPEVRRSNDGGALRSINYGSYPISRTITVGLNFTF
jgi:TonB-dependent starch-binding outer membrane protein SusC